MWNVYARTMSPATPVAVVTDSTHYIPRELVIERGIHVVSLYVNQGGQLTKESDMPDFEAFYDGLRTAAELPTTSQPSIGDFIEVYEPLVAAGHDIVSIHLSGGLSGTVESGVVGLCWSTGPHPCWGPVDGGHHSATPSRSRGS